MMPEELEARRRMAADFWDCFFRHHEPQDTKAWWEQFLDEARGLYRKHKETDENAARKMAVMCLETVQKYQMEVERESR